MPKDCEEVKIDEPGIIVTVSLPALIISGSSSPCSGYGPMPSRPERSESSTRREQGRRLVEPRTWVAGGWTPTGLALASGGGRSPGCARVLGLRSLLLSGSGTVLGLQLNADARLDKVARERRDTDAEIDVVTVIELERSTLDDAHTLR